MGWDKPPTLFAAEVRSQTKEHIGAAALHIHMKLVQKTPVRTGRARSNWLPSVGEPATGTTEETSPTRVLAEATTQFHPKNLPDNPVLYISNNLPYIERLNNGWSKQAPAHFVEMTIQEVLDEF